MNWLDLKLTFSSIHFQEETQHLSSTSAILISVLSLELQIEVEQTLKWWSLLTYWTLLQTFEMKVNKWWWWCVCVSLWPALNYVHPPNYLKYTHTHMDHVVLWWMPAVRAVCCQTCIQNTAEPRKVTCPKMCRVHETRSSRCYPAFVSSAYQRASFYLSRTRENILVLFVSHVVETVCFLRCLSARCSLHVGGVGNNERHHWAADQLVLHHRTGSCTECTFKTYLLRWAAEAAAVKILPVKRTVTWGPEGLEQMWGNNQGEKWDMRSWCLWDSLDISLLIVLLSLTLRERVNHTHTQTFWRLPFHPWESFK